MTYRLQITSKGSIYHEVFREDLGSLHLFAEENGYYGQRVVIHEVIEALDCYEEISVVDTYTLPQCQTDLATGSQRPLRAPLRVSSRSDYQKT